MRTTPSASASRAEPNVTSRPAKLDVASGGADHARRDLGGGALAGPVLPDERVHLRRRQRHGQLVHRDRGAVDLADAAQAPARPPPGSRAGRGGRSGFRVRAARPVSRGRSAGGRERRMLLSPGLHPMPFGAGGFLVRLVGALRIAPGGWPGRAAGPGEGLFSLVAAPQRGLWRNLDRQIQICQTFAMSVTSALRWHLGRTCPVSAVPPVLPQVAGPVPAPEPGFMR